MLRLYFFMGPSTLWDALFLWPVAAGLLVTLAAIAAFGVVFWGNRKMD